MVIGGIFGGVSLLSLGLSIRNIFSQRDLAREISEGLSVAQIYQHPIHFDRVLNQKLIFKIKGTSLFLDFLEKPMYKDYDKIN